MAYNSHFSHSSRPTGNTPLRSSDALKRKRIDDYQAKDNPFLSWNKADLINYAISLETRLASCSGEHQPRSRDDTSGGDIIDSGWVSGGNSSQNGGGSVFAPPIPPPLPPPRTPPKFKDDRVIEYPEKKQSLYAKRSENPPLPLMDFYTKKNYYFYLLEGTLEEIGNLFLLRQTLFSDWLESIKGRLSQDKYEKVSSGGPGMHTPYRTIDKLNAHQWYGPPEVKTTSERGEVFVNNQNAALIKIDKISIVSGDVPQSGKTNFPPKNFEIISFYASSDEKNRTKLVEYLTDIMLKDKKVTLFIQVREIIAIPSGRLIKRSLDVFSFGEEAYNDYKVYMRI